MYIGGKYTGFLTLSPFLSFTFRKTTRERKKDWVGTPVYFPPIYIETVYYFNPVQASYIKLPSMTVYIKSNSNCARLP